MRFDSIISHEIIDIRREEVRCGSFGFTGIDFIDVNTMTVGDKTVGVLAIHLIKPIDSFALNRANFKISGGSSINNLSVISITPTSGSMVSEFNIMLNVVGDSSIYSLEIIDSIDASKPHQLFDALLSYTDFVFAAGNEVFDSTSSPPSALEKPIPPGLDYLAKDYSSFKRLILDRMATVVPSWHERNPADLGIALVEAVAFAGDQLSYYQDAVATEAYLDTARLRNSVRRHALLLDYRLHDGCNARTLVKFDLNGTEPITIKKGTMFSTNIGEPGQVVTRTTDQLLTDILRGVCFFEAIFDKKIHPALNDLHLHTWGAQYGMLPAGSTSAYLIANLITELPSKGAVMVFYEKGEDPKSPTQHVHAVRLQSVDEKAILDTVANCTYFRVSWHKDDALPFDLRWGLINNTHYWSGCWGNIVLADHGLSVTDKAVTITHTSRGTAYPITLAHKNVTFASPIDTSLEGIADTAPTVSNSKLTLVEIYPGPINELLVQDPRKAIAAVTLKVDPLTKWTAVPDLMSSDRFACHMVAENDDLGRVHLRFGDGVSGRLPMSGTAVTPCYRLGSGTMGNLGADSLVQIITKENDEILNKIIAGVTNPLGVVGGTDGESPNEARFYAPCAFKAQQRAVTESDYATIAESHREVTKAVARFRWTGSNYLVAISINRIQGRLVDAPFIAEMIAFIEPFRMMGHSVEIVQPEFVPLDITLQVDVETCYLRSTIKAELTDLFSNRLLSSGVRGFFHPDCFTFGQSVFLSDLIAIAAAISGVVSVIAKAFGAKNHMDTSMLQNAEIIINRFAIARCDSDPHKSDNGIIRFEISGGM